MSVDFAGTATTAPAAAHSHLVNFRTSTRVGPQPFAFTTSRYTQPFALAAFRAFSNVPCTHNNNP